jgi:hypothetical protein
VRERQGPRDAFLTARPDQRIHANALPAGKRCHQLVDHKAMRCRVGAAAVGDPGLAELLFGNSPAICLCWA